MDIMVENLKKIRTCFTNIEIAKKWGLLSLCRMEYSFRKFVAFDNLKLEFSFPEIISACIAFVCDGKDFDIPHCIKQISSCLDILYAYEQEYPDRFLCLSLYFSQAMLDICDYLELLASNQFQDSNVDELILSAISEDFLIDFHELESLEEFAENELVLAELKRIWEDYEYIQNCTSEQLRNRAESYRKLNIQAIPENWHPQEI